MTERNEVTIGGVPLVFQAPETEFSDLKMVIAVKQSVIDAANRMDGDWMFVETGSSDGVPIYEAKKR